MSEVVALYNSIYYDKTSESLKGVNADVLQKIRTDIRNHRVVILKNVFEGSLLEDLKISFFKLFLESESSNPKFCSDCPNFFRRDIDPPLSAVKRNKQFATSFYWNKDFFNERPLFQALTGFRNLIAELPENYTINGFEEDGYVTYANITHYPSNGGKLNKHTDPPNKQFCTIMVAMSKKGEDFLEGGLYVEKDGKKSDIDHYLEIGDVYLMNPQTIHGVDVIDPTEDSEINWKSMKGRWILFPALIEAKTALGEKVPGLKDLESQ
jgi:hypothetical protein